jgi:hypothetical protein
VPGVRFLGRRLLVRRGAAEAVPAVRRQGGAAVIVTLDASSVRDYELFLRIKRLPRYRFVGRTAEFPDEYAGIIGAGPATPSADADYAPSPWLFDYQRDITRTAIRKRKFAVFADCGLGKSMIFLEYARHVVGLLPPGKCFLIVTPLMVVRQFIEEATRFYGDSLPIDAVESGDLSAWLARGTGRIGITNWEAMTDGVPQGRLGGLGLDESSMLKSHYGVWGTNAVRLGRGLDWKIAGSGTPAPNDRIEYANHAVFLDQFPTVNAFLARYFVNRGQTDNRWELKPHALQPFYRSLSHWSIFLTNPATYGWRDNCGTLPPIHVHTHDVPLTDEQRDLVLEVTGGMFAGGGGGIGSRTKVSQIAKGSVGGRDIETLKPAFIRRLRDTFPDESCIHWCLYNREQERLAAEFPGAAVIDGDTPLSRRAELINDFKAGRRRDLITKPKILGFGLNLQAATRQIFSGLQDSYEQFYQAVKRSNRYGSTRPLNVHIPVTEAERPMIATVLAKARRVQEDTEQQERMFRDAAF